jgi:predicted amidohydrolase
VRNPLSVCAAQPACVIEDVAANARRHASALLSHPAQLVVFPELSLTGYQLGAAPVSCDDPVLDPIREACARHGSVALVGAPIREGDRDFIATLRVTAAGVDVVYRKVWLGTEEAVRFTAGDEAAVIEVGGWRLGLAVCRDTGIARHTLDLGRCGVDAYVAGLVHHPEELPEQDARGVAIAGRLGVPVVFASAAGRVGDDYPSTAGTSTIWSPAGAVVARASDRPNDAARAVLG